MGVGRKSMRSHHLIGANGGLDDRGCVLGVRPDARRRVYNAIRRSYVTTCAVLHVVVQPSRMNASHRRLHPRPERL